MGDGDVPADVRAKTGDAQEQLAEGIDQVVEAGPLVEGFLWERGRFNHKQEGKVK